MPALRPTMAAQGGRALAVMRTRLQQRPDSVVVPGRCDLNTCNTRPPSCLTRRVHDGKHTRAHPHALALPSLAPPEPTNLRSLRDHFPGPGRGTPFLPNTSLHLPPPPPASIVTQTSGPCPSLPGLPTDPTNGPTRATLCARPP